MPTEYLEEFIVYDDDVGPCMRLMVDGQGARDFLDPTFLDREGIAGNAHSLVVPLPLEIRVTADQVMTMASDFLYDRDWGRVVRQRIDDAVAEQNSALREVWPLVEEFRKAQDEKSLVLSFYLDSSSRLRGNVVRTGTSGALSEDDFTEFLAEPLPRYVWVVEISTRDRARDGGGQTSILGELIFDASVSPKDIAGALIIARLPGVLIRNQGEVSMCTSRSDSHPHWLVRSFEAPMAEED